MANYLDIDYVATKIARLAINTTSQVPDILAHLAELDWDPIIALAIEEIAEEQEEREYEIRERERSRQEWLQEETCCDRCHKRYIRKDLIQLRSGGLLEPVSGEEERVPYKFAGEYCPECKDLTIKEYHALYDRTCYLCGKRFWHWAGNLCGDCDTPYNRREARRLAQQLIRTHNMGLPSDLTLMEWLEIIQQHDGKCAYCKHNDFEDMDHVVPVSKGGGTTADNVLPSCQYCNSRKHDKSRSIVDATRLFR